MRVAVMYFEAVRKRKLASVERSEIFAVFVQTGGSQGSGDGADVKKGDISPR